ncbi:MAG: DUF2062 domain-containing protein [Pseudomonadales bacterium]|jgi:uncharacterized protein (DUF2062 family)|nr:DUF2062 domain-containing protein [Pseudomonadales bacterium]
MPRAFFKRYLPSPASLARRGGLRILGSAVADPELWHLNRRSVSTAFAVGLFLAFFPFPSQMLLAAAAAVVIRCNLPLSVALVWITNPVTIPPLFWFTYKLGTLLLGVPPRVEGIELSLEWFVTQAGLVWKPLLVGSLLCGAVASATGYVLSNWLWRRQVIQRWERRRALRRLRAPGTD